MGGDPTRTRPYRIAASKGEIRVVLGFLGLRSFEKEMDLKGYIGKKIYITEARKRVYGEECAMFMISEKLPLRLESRLVRTF